MTKRTGLTGDSTTVGLCHHTVATFGLCDLERLIDQGFKRSAAEILKHAFLVYFDRAVSLGQPNTGYSVFTLTGTVVANCICHDYAPASADSPSWPR